jgi:hypothetical protein
LALSPTGSAPGRTGVTRAAIARVTRQLQRLEALAEQHRFRKRIVRLVRGGAGGGAAFLVLLKAKLVAPLAGKLLIAALVGLSLAWPLVALGIVLVVVAVMSIVTCEPTSLDGCDCIGPNKRRERLRALIKQRRTWLAEPSGELPSIGRGRMRSRSA